MSTRRFCRGVWVSMVGLLWVLAAGAVHAIDPLLSSSTQAPGGTALSLGRLFLSPQMRDERAAARQKSRPFTVDRDNEAISPLDGAVGRSLGPPTVWINGQVDYRGRLPDAHR